MKTFKVKAYDSFSGGYPVHRTWPLDSGIGEGGCVIARFVVESEAEHFANYCNAQVEIYDTTDMSVWQLPNGDSGNEL